MRAARALAPRSSKLPNSARERGARRLRVETQDVNVPACRLYHAQGFRLERATPGAYAELPNEVQLLWHKPLR